MKKTAFYTIGVIITIFMYLFLSQNISLGSNSFYVNLNNPLNGTVFESSDSHIVFNWNSNNAVGYELVIAGDSNTYGLNTNNNEANIQISNFSDGTYSRYVIAKNAIGVTKKSETYTFVINKNNIGLNLISPTNHEIINIGELKLIVSGFDNKGFLRQISKNTNFGNIVSSGISNVESVNNVLHNPDFMIGTYYWRAIDQKNNKSSNIQSFTITGNNISSKVQQFRFTDITGAEKSKLYSSNDIIVSGLSNNIQVPAVLENNKGALIVNNIAGSNFLVKNNDKIRIELISNNQYGSSSSSKLILGTGANTVSGTFTIYNKNDGTGGELGGNLSFSLRLQSILFIENLHEIYKNDLQKWNEFLNIFKAILKDKIDTINQQIINTGASQEESLRTQKEALEYLNFVIEEQLKNIDYKKTSVYIAPNCKEYKVIFDEKKSKYTSPNFVIPRYFSSWDLFTKYIDANNQGNCNNSSINGDTITTPNGKIYTIHTENNKWTSNNMSKKQYFNTRDEIIDYIIYNNPSTTRDHNIDTSFVPVVFVASNGKSYTIFKTSSSGNNANKYSSFMFVAPKYFNSLEAAKNHITQQNK